MGIFYLILALAVYFFTTFLKIYSCDKLDILYDNRPRYLKMPSIQDLKSLDDKNQLELYIKEVIVPSRHYFNLAKELTDKKSDSGELLSNMALYFSSFSLVFLSILKCIDQYTSLYGFASLVVCLIVSILICVIGYITLRKIYKMRYALPVLDFTEEDLRGDILNNDPKFETSTEVDFNNYAISIYHHFLLRYEEKIRHRRYTHKILNVLTIILWILASLFLSHTS